jgi:hypothetical protein
MIVKAQIPLQPDEMDPFTQAHDVSLRLLFHAALQASLQQVMDSQSRSHFLRHAKGRLQCRQIFSGRLDLWTAFPWRRIS